MKKILLALALAGAVASFGAEASAGRTSGAVIGGTAGAVVAGPPGAVVGGVIGAAVGGPNFHRHHRWWRHRRSHR